MGSQQVAPCVTQDAGFYRLKAHLIAATGLAYYQDHDQQLAELIGRRLSELGVPDCASYSERLAGDAGREELDALTARLTIGETYFFRDREQFDAIREVVLPEILSRKQASKQLRIWSAGCANGAEAYSLAILLARDLGDRLAGWQVSIFGTDINRRSLAEAREGKFQEWTLRSTSAEVRRWCFSSEGQSWVIRPAYKQWTAFAHMNLVDTEFPSLSSGVADFDLILCRNVMIYFASEVNRRLIGQFHASLAEGGWFLPGAVEYNMENFSSFDTVNAAGATLYRKSAGKALAKAAASGVVGPRESAAPVGPTGAPERALCKVSEHERPAPVAPELPNVDGLRRLADRGDWENAVPCCRRLLAQDGLNPVVYYYQALVQEHMGVCAEAERSLRQAIYLDRSFLLAHYHLGLVLTKKNQPRTAARSFENVVKLATGMRDDQIVEDGDGVTVAGLKEMAKMQLQNLGVS